MPNGEKTVVADSSKTRKKHAGIKKPKRTIINWWKFGRKLLTVLPLLIALGASFFFYVQWQLAQDKIETVPSEQVKDVTPEEIDEIVKALEKIVLLPTGETPKLSTITNKDELTDNQEFFKDVENGDKIIVYQQAKKAFLYRPSTKKIINLSPIDITGGEDQPVEKVQIKTETSPTSSPETVSSPVTVELRNGTEVAGLTLGFESKLKATGVDIEVTKRSNAAYVDYGESVLVMVNLTRKIEAQLIANALDMSVSVLPDDEEKTEADILIIVGKDQVD